MLEANVSKQIVPLMFMGLAIVVAVLAIIIFGGAKSCTVVAGKCAVTQFGVTLSYPKTWSSDQQKFTVSSTAQKTGLAIISPGKKAAISLAYPYQQSAAEAKDVTGAHATMLLSYQKIKGLYNTFDVRTVALDRTTSANVYTPADNLISLTQLESLHLERNSFVANSNPPFIFQPTKTSKTYAVNVNSSLSYSTVAGAIAWFNSTYAKQAHTTLLAAKSAK
jgi:hypothetical protein